MMFDPDFYPTPPAVAQKMLAPFSTEMLLSSRILEPSAGKGDLADAIVSKVGQQINIDCIEQNPELALICRGKNYLTLQADFLTANIPDASKYDLVVMNPPFSNGVDHLLRAWYITACPIVCLLNAETIDNPTSSKRQLLLKLIKDHGEVERLGSCFDSSEAFRRTKVEVVMVRLSKTNQTKQAAVDFGEINYGEEPEINFAEPDLENQLERPDAVSNLVLRHQKCLDLFQEIAKQVQRLYFYAQGVSLWEALEWPLKTISGRDKDMGIADVYDKFAMEFTKQSWDNLFRLTNFHNLASRQVKIDFETFCRTNRKIAFTRENISRVLTGLYASRDGIMHQCVEEAFDYMTAYHKENRVYIEGWKSNDAWRVNRKVVLPHVIDTSYGLTNISGYSVERLDDIDRAMGFLSGKQINDVKTIARAFNEHHKVAKKDWNTKPFESEFFDCRAYKKGTLHIYFKNEWLWERFNIEAAKGKNWLPDDYKHRTKATDKYAVASVR